MAKRRCSKAKSRNKSSKNPIGFGADAYERDGGIDFLEMLFEDKDDRRRQRNPFTEELGPLNVSLKEGTYFDEQEFKKEMRQISSTNKTPPYSKRGFDRRTQYDDGDKFTPMMNGFIDVMGLLNDFNTGLSMPGPCQVGKKGKDRKGGRQGARKQNSQDRIDRIDGEPFCRWIGNVRLDLIPGSLVQRKVDVLVNETNESLSLRDGGLSTAILRAAGEKLQSECQRLYPLGLKLGEIGGTGAFNMKDVKAIYHTTLPKYENTESKPTEVLYSLVWGCLEKATEEKFCSIAFPALGTSRHNYPSKAAACSIISAIDAFLQVFPYSTLRTIEIVVFQAAKNWRETSKNFQHELENIVTQEAYRRQHDQDEATSYEVYPEPLFPPERGTQEWFKMIHEQDVTIPFYWTSVQGGQIVRRCQTLGHEKYQLVRVDVTTENTIKDLVMRSWSQQKVGHGRDARNLLQLGFSSIKVTKVQRVENVHLYKGYAEERQRLFGKVCKKGRSLLTVGQTKYSSGEVETHKILKRHPNAWNSPLHTFSEVNEHFLFHGTARENIDMLLSQGIDNRLAGARAMLGAGTYAAESSTKADQYSDHQDRRTKTGLKMLLVRMSLGEIYVCNEGQQFRRPPCKSCRKDKCTCKGAEHYDSVLADGPWIFREFVVYEKRQVYPEYLISYDRV